MGLSRHIVDRYVDDRIVGIEDRTPLVRRIHTLVREGRTADAEALLPRERPYPLDPALAARIGADRSEPPYTGVRGGARVRG